MLSLSFYYPKANKHAILAGLLACSILDAFPFPTKEQWLWSSRTNSELTAAVSAQDFHLIPFSLITSRREETSTNIKGKFTIFQEVHQIFAYKKATIVFYIQYIIKQKHLKSLFRTLEVHIIVSVVLFCKCCHDKVRKLTATQKCCYLYYVYWTFKNV